MLAAGSLFFQYLCSGCRANLFVYFFQHYLYFPIKQVFQFYLVRLGIRLQNACYWRDEWWRRTAWSKHTYWPNTKWWWSLSCVSKYNVDIRPSKINNMLLVPACLDFGGRTNSFVICYKKIYKKSNFIIFLAFGPTKFTVWIQQSEFHCMSSNEWISLYMYLICIHWVNST